MEFSLMALQITNGHPNAQECLDYCAEKEKEEALKAGQNIEAGNPYTLKRKRD